MIEVERGSVVDRAFENWVFCSGRGGVLERHLVCFDSRERSLSLFGVRSVLICSEAGERGRSAGAR